MKKYFFKNHHPGFFQRVLFLGLVVITLSGCFKSVVEWYLDADGDGYSSGTVYTAVNRPGPDYYLESELTALLGDCDDNDTTVHPEAEEICSDGKDNNCDGTVDCPDNATTIWQPSPGTSWQWQLTEAVDTSFDTVMYDIDLFNVSQIEIDELHADGRKVICYFSAGSWENWRSDADQFSMAVLGNTLSGWSDEKWLDIRRLDVLGPIMKGRFDLAVQKKCDGVEPDNVDAYTNASGFNLSSQDQWNYNVWLSQQAHSRGLSVGLKNDLDQVEALISYFDWALNEQCFEYDECEKLQPFIEAGKAVFGVEYELVLDEFCLEANKMDFDWLKKNYGLDSYRESCR